MRLSRFTQRPRWGSARKVRAPSPTRTQALSTHGGAVRRFDPVKHSYFTRLSAGVAIHAQVLLRHPVDMLVRALLRDLDHPAAYRKVAIRVVGVHDIHAHPRIAAHVLILDAPPRRVDEDVAAVVIDP